MFSLEHLQQPRQISAALKKQRFLCARSRSARVAKVVQRAGRNGIARRLFRAPAPARCTLERPRRDFHPPHPGARAAARTTPFAPATRRRFPGLSPRRRCFLRLPLVAGAPRARCYSDEQRPAAHCRSAPTRCSTKRLQGLYCLNFTFFT